MLLLFTGGIESLQQFFDTMDRQFTDNEWKQIQAPPTDNEKLAMFYRHWVCTVHVQYVYIADHNLAILCYS